MIEAAHTYTAEELHGVFHTERARYPSIRHVDRNGDILPVARGVDSWDYDRLIRDAMEISRRDD